MAARWSGVRQRGHPRRSRRGAGRIPTEAHERLPDRVCPVGCSRGRGCPARAIGRDFRVAPIYPKRIRDTSALREEQERITRNPSKWRDHPSRTICITSPPHPRSCAAVPAGRKTHRGDRITVACQSDLFGVLHHGNSTSRQSVNDAASPLRPTRTTTTGPTRR